MSVLTWPVAVVAALIVSANTKLHLVLFGQPVAVPVLWLVAAGVVLTLAALVLFLLWQIAQERRPYQAPAVRPEPVYVITTLP